MSRILSTMRLYETQARSANDRLQQMTAKQNANLANKENLSNVLTKLSQMKSQPTKPLGEQAVVAFDPFRFNPYIMR